MTTASPPTIISRRNIDQIGLSRYRLYTMANNGELEQIAPGYYVQPNMLDDTTAGLASIALRNPKATLCLLSALSLHDLTDEIPRRTNIALPRGDRTLINRFLPVIWHAFARETFDLGRGAHHLIDDIQIGLYSPERTLIDLFRLRHEFGTDLAIDALKRWLGRRESSPAKLLDLATAFPKTLPKLRSTLEILL